jgi:hypothetical protein
LFFSFLRQISIGLLVAQGMQAQITKAVLSQALLFMSKDQFEHWALAIMILAARFSTRS